MNNFKDYGFEADFEGEILKKIIGRGVDDGIATDRLIGFIKDEYGIIKMAEWWDDGILRDTCKLNEKYNLKPIKKEWYENADNVGKLIVYDYFNDNRIGIFKCLHKDKGWIELYTLNGCKVDQKTHKVRPATKEEVLSLLVKKVKFDELEYLALHSYTWVSFETMFLYLRELENINREDEKIELLKGLR